MHSLRELRVIFLLSGPSSGKPLLIIQLWRTYFSVLPVHVDRFAEWLATLTELSVTTYNSRFREIISHLAGNEGNPIIDP